MCYTQGVMIYVTFDMSCVICDAVTYHTLYFTCHISYVIVCHTCVIYDIRTGIHADMQTYRRTDIQTYRPTDVQTHRHTDIRIQTCTHAYAHPRRIHIRATLHAGFGGAL